MISFLFIMFTTNIATTETVSLHVDTMVRKNGLIFFKKYIYNEDFGYESDLKGYNNSDIEFLQKNLNEQSILVSKKINYDGRPINFKIKYNNKSNYIIIYQK